MLEAAVGDGDVEDGRVDGGGVAVSTGVGAPAEDVHGEIGVGL